MWEGHRRRVRRGRAAWGLPVAFELGGIILCVYWTGTSS